MDSGMFDVDFGKEIKVDRADCIFRLGIIEQDSELRHEKSSRLYQRALNVQSQMGNILGEALCRKRLADKAMAARRHDKAQEHYEQARLLCQKVPYYKGLADCSYSLADLVLKQKDTIQAEALYREALDLYVMTSSEHGKANFRCSLADVVSCKCLEEGAGRPIEEIKRVRESYYEIQRTYIALNDDIGQANCLSGISDAERLLGNEQKADELFVQAMTVAQGAFGSSVNVDPAIKLDVPYLRRWRR